MGAPSWSLGGKSIDLPGFIYPHKLRHLSPLGLLGLVV
jgi:hypothetical protein